MAHTHSSAALAKRALEIVPSGVSTNTRARLPHPLYFSRADGAHAWDVGGDRYLDLVMGNGAILLGHGYEPVQEAVAKAVKSGLTCGVESDSMVAAAEAFCGAVPWPDLVRFTNTGTEAVQHALHIARHATGRNRIAKVEGSYHGWSDEVFVSVWADLQKAGPIDAITSLPQFAGQRQDLVDEVVVLPFNDVARTEAVLEKFGSEIAALLLEPILIDIGFIPATDAYLAALRSAADTYGFVLIYDELLTGFNVAPGGVATNRSIHPDLALYGKAIANGYPLAAVAGREDLMRMTEPGKGPAFVGTFNGHAIAVAAAAATLPILATGEVQTIVDDRTSQLSDAFSQTAQTMGVAARMVCGGSHLHWYFLDGDVHDYRSAARTDAGAYAAFTSELAARNILFLANPMSHQAISLAHEGVILDELNDAFSAGLAKVANR